MHTIPNTAEQSNDIAIGALHEDSPMKFIYLSELTLFSFFFTEKEIYFKYSKKNIATIFLVAKFGFIKVEREDKRLPLLIENCVRA